MPHFNSPTKGLFFMSDEDMARKTILVNDPNWVRPTVQVPDPAWQRPMIADPAWIRPNIMVPDPNWQAPLTLQPDPNWQRPLVAVTAADGSTVKVLDMGAVQPMIELPDPTAKPNLIEAPDANAKPDLIPDAAAVQPTIAVPDQTAACPLVEAPSPYFNLPADAVEITDAEAAAIQNPAPTLAAAQKAQIASIYAAYQNAIALNVTYTSKAGIAQTFQADPVSVSYVNSMLSAYGAAQATPADFYWVAADNTQVPFTYADLQGLASAMGAQGWAAFQKLQGYKAQINAATTVAAVQAVVWS